MDKWKIGSFKNIFGSLDKGLRGYKFRGTILRLATVAVLLAVVCSGCVSSPPSSSYPAQTSAPSEESVSPGVPYYSEQPLTLFEETEGVKTTVKGIVSGEGEAAVLIGRERKAVGALFSDTDSDLDVPPDADAGFEARSNEVRTYSLLILDEDGVTKREIALSDYLPASALQNSKLAAKGSGYAIAYLDQASESDALHIVEISAEGVPQPELLVGSFGSGSQLHALFFDSEGLIYILGSTTSGSDFQSYAVAYNENGQELFRSLDEHHSTAGWTYGKNLFSDGKAVYVDTYPYEGGCQIRALDIKSGKIGAPLPMDAVGTNAISVHSGSAGVFMTDWSGVYSLDLQSGEKSPLFQWKDLDVDMSADQLQTSILGADRVLVMFSSANVQNELKSRFSMLSKAAVNPHAGKEIIYIGGANISRDKGLKKAVYTFNLLSDSVRAEVFDYYQPQGAGIGTQDYAELLDKLASDVMSGKKPDILVGNSYLPLSFYEGRGLLANLGDWMAADADFDETEYFANLLFMKEREDGLYQLFPSFFFSGFAGSESFLENRTGWTIDEFISTANQLPEKTSPLGNIAYEALLSASFQASSGELLDFLTVTASFDRDSFKELLNYAKTYGRSAEAGGNDAYINPLEQIQNRELALLPVRIKDVSIFNGLLSVFGESVNIVGSPSVNKSGPVCSAALSYGIVQESGHQAYAWEFLKCLLSPQMQLRANEMGGLPIRIDALSAWIAEEKQISHGISEIGSDRVSRDGIYYTQTSSGAQLSDKDAEAFLALVERLNSYTESDIAIMQILSEESAAFFSGRQTDSQTALSIQNRVQALLHDRASR